MQKFLIPIILIILFLVLRAIQQRNGRISSFEILIVFFSIFIYTTFQIVFYDNVFSKLPLDVMKQTLNDVLSLDPTNKIRGWLQNDLSSITAEDAEQQQKEVTKSNQKSLYSSELSWWMIASGILAILSVCLYFKELRKNRTFVAAHAVVFGTLFFVFSIELLIYFMVFKPFVYILKSDILRSTIQSTQSQILSFLVSTWNANQNLRESVDNAQDLDFDIVPIMQILNDQLSDLQDLEFADDGQDIYSKQQVLEAVLSAIVIQLKSLSSSPCPVNYANDSKLTTSSGELKDAMDSLKATLASTQLTRMEIQLQYQKIFTSLESTLPLLDKLGTYQHCDIRSETRARLVEMKKEIIDPQTSDLPTSSLWSKLKANWHIVLCGTIAIFYAVLVVAGYSAAHHHFDIICMAAIFIVLGIFQISFISFVEKGTYITEPNNTDGKPYLLYSLLH